MKLTFYFFIASVANVENNAFLYKCDENNAFLYICD